ncbi:MAG: IS630 transposase-related protein [Rubrobacteraceae bacterium]
MGIYSKDLRVRAVDAVERGVPRRDVVRTFPIPLTTLKRWLRRKRAGEDLSPGTSTGRKRRILSTAEEERALWRQLEENDGATLERHCEMWEQKTGVLVSISAMSRAIRGKLGWTYKKRRWRPPSETRRREALFGKGRGVSTRSASSSWTSPPRTPPSPRAAPERRKAGGRMAKPRGAGTGASP